MDEFVKYAPIILVVIGFAITYKIFVTPSELEKQFKNFERKIDKKYMTSVDFQDKRADFLAYIQDKFVSIKTCSSQNMHITDAINLLRNDVKQMDSKIEHMTELIMMRIQQNREDK